MRLGTFSNSGLGFGLMFSLVDDFTYNARRIERQMQTLSGASATLAASTEMAMARAKVGAGGMLIALVGLAGWAKAAKVDAIFQNYELALRSFLGSAEEAHRVFEQVKQDAIQNPKFSIAGMEKANLLLVSQGTAADKSRQVVKDLSMVLLGVGRGEPELQRVALAFEKISANKIMEGQHFRSLTTAGLPVVAMLKDIGVNLNPSKVKSAGISIDVLGQALHNAVQPGQRFGRVLEMLRGNVGAVAAQLKENWQATLADIGKAIRPATLAILNFLGNVVSKIQSFAATDTGKFILRMAFALNVLLFGLSAFVLVSSLAKVALFRLATVLPAASKATVMTALGVGNLTRAWGAALGGAFSLAVGLLPLIGRMLAMAFVVRHLSSTTNEGLYIMGTAFLFLLGPLGRIMAIYTFVSRAFREFNAVLDGSAKPAQGLVGWFQRLGGALKFIGAAFSGYNALTHEIEVPKRLIQTLDALGMGDWARKMATWIGRVMEAWEGFKKQIEVIWGVVKTVILGIANVFRPANEQLRNWDDFIGRNTTSLDTWQKYGRMVANGLVLMGIAWGIMGVASVVNSARAAIGFLVMYGDILLLAAGIGVLVKLFRDFTGSSDDAANSVVNSFGSIDGVGMGQTLGLGIRDGIINGILMGGNPITNALKGDKDSYGRKMHYQSRDPFWWVPGRTGVEDLSADQYSKQDNWVNKLFGMRFRSYADPLEGKFSLNPGFNVGQASAVGALNPALAGSLLAALEAQKLAQGTNLSQKEKGGPLTVNLNVDGRNLAQVVVDTMNYNRATGYGSAVNNQLGDTTYGNQSYLDYSPDHP